MEKTLKMVKSNRQLAGLSSETGDFGFLFAAVCMQVAGERNVTDEKGGDSGEDLSQNDRTENSLMLCDEIIVAV